MKRLTDDQLEAVYLAAIRDTNGDDAAARRVLYEMGRLCPRRAREGNADARRQARKAEAAEFMRRRWAGILEPVARRHGVALEQLFDPRSRPRQVIAAVAEAAWLLRNQARLCLEDVGAILGRNYSTVPGLVAKMEARIAAEPGLRDALVARAGRWERRAVAA